MVLRDKRSLDHFDLEATELLVRSSMQSVVGSILLEEILNHNKGRYPDKPWVKQRIKELDKGEVEKVITAFKKLSPVNEQSKEILQKEIGYFDRNKERIRYKKYKDQGLFIGSGVIEAECRAVIGQRLKQSGMHWSVKNANNIISLRCCIMSNR